MADKNEYLKLAPEDQEAILSWLNSKKEGEKILHKIQKIFVSYANKSMCETYDSYEYWRKNYLDALEGYFYHEEDLEKRYFEPHRKLLLACFSEIRERNIKEHDANLAWAMFVTGYFSTKVSYSLEKKTPDALSAFDEINKKEPAPEPKKIGFFRKLFGFLS